MPDSNVSVTSSQYRRRLKRASVLRKIIYLKRRCIRCCLTNVFFSAVHLGLAAYTMLEEFKLIYNQTNLFYSTCLFLACTILMLIGSIISLHALTRKLLKWSLLVGKVLMTTAYIFNIVALIGTFSFKGAEGTTKYGYQVDLIEDCEAYPDHVFTFVVSPASRKGRPLVVDSDENGEENEIGADQSSDPLNSSLSTTEELVTKTYNCDEMLSNIKWFKISFGFMILFCVVTSITMTLLYMGIFHLCWINSKGQDFLILPPALVEPYEFYDELMKRNVSITSLASDELQTRRKHDGTLIGKTTRAALANKPTKIVTKKTTRLFVANEANQHDVSHKPTLADVQNAVGMM